MGSGILNSYKVSPNHFWQGTACWEWTGSRFASGYGQLPAQRDTGSLAHRASWRIHYGLIPHGMCVLHHCDNPPCINPSHLFVGTNKDNSKDMVAKGRSANGDRNGCYGMLGKDHPAYGKALVGVDHPRWGKGYVIAGENNGCYGRVGEKHPLCKLAEDDVRKIKCLLRGGQLTQGAIGAQFGVKQSTVSRIHRGISWSHVQA